MSTKGAIVKCVKRSNGAWSMDVQPQNPYDWQWENPYNWKLIAEILNDLIQLI